MFFCFVFGHEPWFLPPAVEMAEVLMQMGHKVKVIYAEYKGQKPNAEDYNPAMTYAVVPPRQGFQRMFLPGAIAAEVKRLNNEQKIDVVIACDILALQAIHNIKGVKKGYWGFEIINKPEGWKPSLSIIRSLRFPGYVRDMDFFVAPSQSRVDKIVARVGTGVSHAVIYNCRAEDKKTLNKQHDIPRLVYTGSISAAQYIEEIIGAVALLDIPVRLDIAGPCSDAYEQHLRQYIHENGLDTQVRLHGRISRKEAYELVEQAYIGFVFYNEHSGAEAGDPAPNKLSDYIAGNTWMIGSDQPYIKYWLEERGAGEVVKTVTKETIAQALRNILAGPRYKDTVVLEHIYRSELNMNAQVKKLLDLTRKQ